VIGGITLIRLLGNFSSSSSAPLSTSSEWAVAPAPVQSSALPVYSPIREARRAEEALCASVKEGEGSAACATAHDLRRAYERGDCKEIGALTRLLGHSIPSDGHFHRYPSPQEQALDRARASFDDLSRTRCPEASSP
jgi:hypothetical protein